MIGGKEAGKCPLKHTNVSARVSGYLSRVTVTQVFENPFKDKIEAVYTFPLSESGAVDDMKMKIGDRIVHGTIKKREEARQIYETAKARGYAASLLDQERTNIFTQSVANIAPGKQIEITIQYVEMLPYEAGRFTFAFPTVVGPRFMPGRPAGHQGTGWSSDTTGVPDASKISPPVAAKDTRAGHDISIDVTIDAGVRISNLDAKLHEVDVKSTGADSAVVTLKNKAAIPNKDFVLSWDVSGDQIKSGYLTHRDNKSQPGYFTLMILPPKRVTPAAISPKEMIFLIDCSGSQSGPPLEKAKETLKYIIDHMNANDTFQILAFNNNVTQLFDKPQKVDAEMKAKANAFIGALTANGGTWMQPAVEQACSIAPDDNRLRIVTFMTDGLVGNDFQILGLVKKMRGTSRWFPFGTGNSVNRMLIDGMAREGGGEAEYVLLNSPGHEVGKKFYDRISSPVLTDVKLDFGDLSVKEVFPHAVSDVWAERPLYIKGRYLKPGAGTVTISGFAGGKPYTQKLQVNFPEENRSNNSIGSIWARAKVDRLMSEDLLGAQRSEGVNKELKDEIVKVALDHHIMTQYTSFVAVEEKVVTEGGATRTVAVEVEMPEGMSREKVFGEQKDGSRGYRYLTGDRMRNVRGAVGGGGGGGAGAASGRFAFTPNYWNAGTLKGRSSQSLPATTMGRFMHMAGDNQYSASPAAAPPVPGSGASAGFYGQGAAATTAAGYLAKPKQSLSMGQEKGQSSQPGFLQDSEDKKAKKDEKERREKAEELASPAKALKLPGNAANFQKLDTILQKLVLGTDASALAGIKVEDGKVFVEVDLKNFSESTVKKLKEIGLEIVSQKTASASISGRIAIDRLEKLIAIDAVKHVRPSKN